MSVNFEGFGKIARLNRECVVTEKIDGTNAQILILLRAETKDWDQYPPQFLLAGNSDMVMLAGSRTKFLSISTKNGDNYGFGRWVYENNEELFKLGPGRHFGEWWGKGIQRGYGLEEKRFSLFNTARWGKAEDRPACVGVVPVLYQGPFTTEDVNGCVKNLKTYGSMAVPGYMNPEGVVVYHTAANELFKVTCEGDEKWKGPERKEENG